MSRRTLIQLAILAIVSWGTWLTVLQTAHAQSRDTRQREGLHENAPAHFLIRNATVHVDPQTTLEGASIVIRNTKIVAVGQHVPAPQGAVVIDGTGKHVYAGLIDGYVAYSEAIETPAIGPRYWNDRVRPEVSVAASFRPSGIRVNDLRRAGITAAHLAPRDGIIRGRTALVHVSEQPLEQLVLAADVALAAELTVSRRAFAPDAVAPTPGATRYPSSPMGAYALARQAFYDAQWYRDAVHAAPRFPLVDPPEFNVSLAAMVAHGDIPLLVQTSNEIAALRARRFADEFQRQLIVLGSGNEYRRLEDMQSLHATFIVPVDFPAPPQVADATAALDVTLESLMHWDHAPENPKRLAEAKIPFVLTTLGLSRPGDFLPNVRKAIKRGLDPQAALAAVTVQPAALFKVSDQLGTISPGKYANLVMFDKPIFDDEAKLVESWAAGDRLILDLPPPQTFTGVWQFAVVNGQLGDFEIVVRGDAKLSGSIKRMAAAEENVDEIKVANWSVRDTQLSASVDSKVWNLTGKAMFSFVIDQPGQAAGHVFLPDGQLVSVTGTRIGDPPAEAPRTGRGGSRPDRNGASDQAKPNGNPSADAQDNPAATGDQDDKPKKEIGPALFPANYPLGDFGRLGVPSQPQSVLIHNVTVWTCGPEGVVVDGAVLFGNGVIQRIIKPGESRPAADLVIDGRGGHVTPGLIDCHSHMGTDSGINEGTQAITAEVRIGDFIDPRDINIYRQLAGGLTCANILHGSANPIGGQNQVIKLRWGSNDADLKFHEAPPGIKFALGENVKQSNRREPSTRYPQTRMGVEQLMHDAFRAAQEYTAAHERWRTTRQGIPPRFDLELEALAEIVQGKRWIHCHSYRQDEILALIRVLDEFHIRIGTFQHILEGYKVAPEMAQHGAMASAFSDWWAYKFEVYDAIPHAGALMHEAGVIVSFNSDDAELARHMNHEAAKAVRYGGVAEEEALKFVTLNPAKQLRIEQWVGSLEPGKHADWVLWNGHPLSTMSRCEQTWIDGRKYFDRDDEAALVIQQSKQRAELIQKVLDSGETPARPGEGRVDSSLLWPRYDEFCQGHRHSSDCWHNLAESTCDACHQCSEDDWLCLFGYCRAVRHDLGACGMSLQTRDAQFQQTR